MNNNKDKTIAFDIIGTVSSPYKEKFAIPRQPGIIKSAKGSVILQGECNNLQIVEGLEQYSHIWLMFIFHQTQDQGWKSQVRPPRLGGNKKLGVLATRSTFRPNPIGMSVVKLDKITTEGKNVVLEISGIDLLDKTPIVDIKPYIPYSDAIDDAHAGFAQHMPEPLLKILFSEDATNSLNKYQQDIDNLKDFIEQVLMQDPRPAYKKSKQDEKIYGMHLYHLNIQWKMTSLQTAKVIAITAVERKIYGEG